MDLKYLVTFRTIAEEGSFSKAAEKLGYTQSAITFQMGQLEEELSARLFEKVGRRMVLTQAGEELVPYVDEVLASVDKLRFFRQDLDQCRGELRIGAAETQLCYRLPAVFRGFCEKAPQARLLIQSMSCYDIRDALLAGKLDVGVLYQDIGGVEGSLTCYPLGECPVVLVASPQRKAAHPDYETPGQKLPFPLIINESNSVFAQRFQAYLRARAIRLDHTIHLESIPTIKNLTASGVGITVLPRFTVEEELAAGTLAEIPIPMEGAVLHPVCAHHKNKWLSPLARLFLKEVSVLA